MALALVLALWPLGAVAQDAPYGMHPYGGPPREVAVDVAACVDGAFSPSYHGPSHVEALPDGYRIVAPAPNLSPRPPMLMDLWLLPAPEIVPAWRPEPPLAQATVGRGTYVIYYGDEHSSQFLIGPIVHRCLHGSLGLL